MLGVLRLWTEHQRVQFGANGGLGQEEKVCRGVEHVRCGRGTVLALVSAAAGDGEGKKVFRLSELAGGSEGEQEQKR